MPHPKDNYVKISGSNNNMKKTYKEFQEQVLEKTLSPEDIDDLIDKSIEGVTQPLRRKVHFIHQLFYPL